MAVIRKAAEYVYTLKSYEPLRNAYVEYDSETGTIVSTGICGDDCPDEILPVFHSL